MPSIHDQVVSFEGQPYSDQKPSDIVVHETAKDKIKIDKVTIDDFFGDRFRIPEYQRGYQWEKQQWEDLWTEIDNFIEAGENLDRTGNRANDVFFGSMFFSERKAADVFESEEEGVVFDIIDGQQRLTTLTIIFKIIAEGLQNALSDCDDGTFVGKYAQHIGLTNNLIYKGDDSSTGPAVTLEPRNRDFFNALMRDDDALYTYLLYQDQVPTQSRGSDQIQVKEYLNRFDIDEDEYLSRLLDSSYFANNREDEYLSQFLQEDKYTNLNGKRPNVQLYSKDKKVIEENSRVSDLTGDERDEILENRVEFDGSNKLLYRCHKYFEDKINRQIENKSPKERYRFLTNVKNYIINSFRVGKFKIQDDRPALLMKIFEVLNDRGLELKKTDLIRTKLVGKLNKLPSDEKESYVERYNELIERFGSNHKNIVTFLETYFVIEQKGISSRGDVSAHLLEAFREDSSQDSRVLQPKLTTPQDAKDLIEDLDRYSRYYKQITEPVRTGGFEIDTDSEYLKKCNRQLHRLNQTDTNIWEPLVLAFYHDIKKEQIDNINRLHELLNVVESLVIRYYVAGDINAKDSIYEKGIEKYKELGVSNDVEDSMIKEAWENDQDVFGENLVSALASTKWSSKRARPVLQKITSEDLKSEGKETLLNKSVNQNTNQVELEHVFPQSALQESNKYQNVKNFFRITDTESPVTINEETTFVESIKYLISNDEEDRIEDLLPQFSNLIGNMALIVSDENKNISNEEFSIKLLGYASTMHFTELKVNREIIDILTGSPIPDSEIPMDLSSKEEYNNYIRDELDPSYTTEFNSLWNWERVWENNSYLISEVMESIEFDSESVDTPTMSEEDIRETVMNEKDTLEDIVRANNRRYI